MLVVDVWTLVVPSEDRLSAGRPLAGSVIATNDAQVSRAYRRSVALSALDASEPPGAPAPGARVADATVIVGAARARVSRAARRARSRGARLRVGIEATSGWEGSGRGQPLSPVVAMPSVIQRWNRTNTIRTGTTSITEPAMSIP